MPIDLPEHVKHMLGVSDPIELSDLADSIAKSHEKLAAFGLSDEDVTQILAEERLTQGETTVSLNQRDIRAWRSLNLEYNGTLECQLVYIPGSETDLPPTAVGQLLLKAWLNKPELLVDNRFVPGSLVTHIPRTPRDSTFLNSLSKNWIMACQLHDGSLTLPIWVGHKTVIADANSRILNKDGLTKFNELFIDSLSEFKPKWRFLSLYRILEHGYLAEVHKNLNASFFLDPKKSLSNGAKALESEMNQLISLVQGNGLENDFDVLDELFEQNKAASNRFAWAVDKEVQNQSPKWKRGVAVYYKLRCLIAHAGMNGPVYDAYPDADACLEKLLPQCEMLSIKFLGVTIT